jgi:tetratricopeptide (TPR) repeat protein
MKVPKILVSIFLVVFVMAGFLTATPQQAKQYLDYGNKYLKAKQYDNAIAYYNQSNKQGASTDAYYFMGVAYFYKSDKASALRNFQYALKLNPSNTAAKAMIAKLSGGAAASAGGSGPAAQYLVTGHKYLKARQYDMAIKYYQASANVAPSAQAFKYMGTAYYFKGDMTNAKAAYEKSLQMNPNDPGVRSVLAKIGSGEGGEARISQQMGVHPLLLATLFAGAIAILFLF